MTVLLIGIAGPKRSGKNTLAKGLSQVLGVPEDSFAAPLRQFVATILNISLEELERRKESQVDWLTEFPDVVTPRSMMQTVGTEWGRRMVHQELWVRSFLARHNARSTGSIVSDVRFPNEAEAIQARGGVIFRVSRAGTGVGDNHASEIPLPDELVNVELPNNGTPEELVARALRCLSWWTDQPNIGKI